MSYIILEKEGSINLSKEQGLNNVLVGLYWDENYSGGHDFDLDASAFLIHKNGKAQNIEDFVFYGKKPLDEKGMVSSYGRSIVYHGDNQTGGSTTDDDEKITVTLDKIPDFIDKIVFTVTIYNAKKRGQTFKSISKAGIRLVNEDTDVEIARFNLSEDYITEIKMENAFQMGEIYRDPKQNGEWAFRAIGTGHDFELAGFIKMFGLERFLG